MPSGKFENRPIIAKAPEVPGDSLISDMKKKFLFQVVATTLLILFFVVVAEMAARFMYFHKHASESSALKYFVKEMQGKSGGAGDPESEELKSFISDESQFEDLIPSFLEDRIAFGNTPFEELRSDESKAVFEDKDGILHNRPNQRYSVAFIKSRIFNAWDSPLYKDMDLAKPNSQKTQDFLKRYGLVEKINTTDANGDRVTVPESSAEDIILVVGDSVAYGAGVGDDETLSSCLQLRYPGFRFVNVGVPGCGLRDSLARVRARLELFKGRVKGLIYVHCENDFNEETSPEFIVNELSDLIEKNKIPYKSFIYTYYIYRAFPDVVRFSDELPLREYFKLKNDLVSHAEKRGLPVIDTWQMMNDYRHREGTPLAGLSLYVDHTHFSRLGNEKVADLIKISL